MENFKEYLLEIFEEKLLQLAGKIKEICKRKE